MERPRTTLRTKKGCNCCRARRKKCDERKPVCVTCQRIGLVCSWPDIAALEDRRERGAIKSRWASDRRSSERSLNHVKHHPSAPESPSSCDQNSKDPYHPLVMYLISEHAVAESQLRRHLLINYYIEHFIPANILPKAREAFSTGPYVLQMAQSIPELMDTVYACSAIHLANVEPAYAVEALRHYSRAVSGLRKRLSTGSLTGLEDWLLAMTVLLHVCELWRSDPSTPGAFQHLSGAVQLFRIRCLSPQRQAFHAFDVLMAESILYHTSTLSVSCSTSLDDPVDVVFWAWMEHILSRPAFTGFARLVNHPVLGVPRTLHKLVFEISKLSKKAPLSSEKDLHEAHQLNYQLDWLEANAAPESYLVEEDSTTTKFPGEQEPELDPYRHISQLYMLCCRLMLLWLISTTKLSQHTDNAQSETRKIIGNAIEILRTIEASTNVSWTFLTRWPLLILGHAVENEEDMQVIRIAFERTWLSSRCGDVKRTLEQVENVWRIRLRGTSLWGLDSLIETRKRSEEL